jgi:hypothetical protein
VIFDENENMRFRSIYIIPPILFLIILACEPPRQVSPVPEIEFKQFTLFDTIDILGNPTKGGLLEFNFIDGDGDLGLQQPFPGQTDTTNLFFTLYRKIDGIFVEALDNDILKPFDFRIPYIERIGQNKIIEGTVSITLFYLFYEADDTIKYDFVIQDRAGNQSNTASTCEIYFTLDGGCKPGPD